MFIFPKNPKNKGFTLIELLVVIAIIGVLGSVVMSSLNSARAKSRDAGRKIDLQQIRTAINMYYNDHGNYFNSNSGCGYKGTGWGFFNHYDGGVQYPKSIAQCLIDEGYLKPGIIDPTGGTSSTYSSGFSYMKSTNCGTPQRTYICAKLETLPLSSTATDGTCYPSLDSEYGMNYCLVIQ